MSTLSHIIPKRHQFRFAGKDGLLWLYDRRRGAIACDHPNNIAAETDFYAWEKPCPGQVDIEKFLAEKIEDPFWDSLERLEQKIPTNSDRLQIALYAAFLFTRVSGFREALIKPFCDAMLHCDLQKNLDALGDFVEQTNTGLFVPKLPKNHVLRQMTRQAILITKELIQLETHLIYSAPDEPFIITDNPIVFVRMVRDDDKPPTILSKSFLKSFPVTARVMIGFGLPGHTVLRSEMNSSQTRKHNFSMAAAARDIVMAGTREQLESVLSAFPKDTPRGPGKYPTLAA